MPDVPSPEDVERAVRALEIEDECGLCHGEGSWWSDCGDSTCDCDGSVTQCPRCAQTGRARRYPKNYAEAAERIPHVLAALAASLPQREPAADEETRHVIQFTERGWTIQHPLAERPNLFDCELSWEGGPPEKLGRYVLNDDGTLGDEWTPAVAPQREPETESQSGAESIAAERWRQVEHEGWVPGYDDGHRPGVLANAALSYAEAGAEQLRTASQGNQVGANELWTRTDWPWDPEWWKPSDDPVRNLVKAGALIAAEIDRIRRLAAPSIPLGEDTDGDA